MLGMEINMYKHKRGNTTTEYLICMVFVLILIVAGNGIFGDGSLFMMFKKSYELFMSKFNATVLNLDAIP